MQSFTHTDRLTPRREDAKGVYIGIDYKDHEEHKARVRNTLTAFDFVSFVVSISVVRYAN